jgi:hypothetical protein
MHTDLVGLVQEYACEIPHLTCEYEKRQDIDDGPSCMTYLGRMQGSTGVAGSDADHPLSQAHPRP